MPKRSIRSRFLAERKSLAADMCAVLSAEIQKRLITFDCLSKAGCVALYSAINNEVSMDAFAAHVLTGGRRLTYPRVAGDALEFVEVASLSELVPGSFGVLEPSGDKVVPLAELNMVVVPGVVFDRGGHRLGYGRGYYDRTLAACRDDCVTVGVAYEFQVVDELPTLEHDRALSMLVTDKQIFNFSAC